MIHHRLKLRALLPAALAVSISGQVMAQMASPPADSNPPAPRTVPDAAQQPGAPAPAVPPTVAPAPPPAAEAPPPAAPAPGQPPGIVSPGPMVDPNATLAGRPGDPMGVDEIVMPAKPALILSGQATWDRGFETLQAIFRQLEGEAGRLGLKVAGRPLSYFIETDDMGFRFDAMLPVDRLPDGTAALGQLRAGMTPPGNALRFVHRAPYDDIDATYEGITAYLDAKGVVVRDQFIEEYVNEAKDAADPNFEINIYVQPR